MKEEKEKDKEEEESEKALLESKEKLEKGLSNKDSDDEFFNDDEKKEEEESVEKEEEVVKMRLEKESELKEKSEEDFVNEILGSHEVKKMGKGTVFYF